MFGGKPVATTNLMRDPNKNRNFILESSILALGRFESIYLDEDKASNINAGKSGISFEIDSVPYHVREHNGDCCLFKDVNLVSALTVVEVDENYCVLQTSESVELIFEN